MLFLATGQPDWESEQNYSNTDDENFFRLNMPQCILGEELDMIHDNF